MNFKNYSGLILLTLVFGYNLAFGQTPLYMSPKVSNAFETNTRSHDGQPGSKYWANYPKYNLDIDFDPVLALLKGKGHIDYINNSPDTLQELTLALLGNIYKENILRDWNISKDATHDGTVINELSINGEDIDLTSKKARVSGTNMYIKLDEPILPNTTTHIDLDWHLLFPEGANIRSGNYGDSTFFISYFYPKVAVYDDIDGWDKSTYSGFTEFYGEFSDFEINITLPGDFNVWATGELQNPKDVYSKNVYKKWQKAQKSEKVISIINKKDLKKNKKSKAMEKKTWTFKAANVTDYAFAFSNNFLWDSRSVVVDKATGRRTVVNAAYDERSKDYVDVAQIAAEALDNFSNKIPGVPYPYPVMSVFNGVSGMEFPMMCNDASQKTLERTVGLTYHEIAHTYFPFYVGINERKYAWMDEGWATFFPAFYFENYEDGSFQNYFTKRRQSYEGIAGTESEAPLCISSKSIRGRTPYRQQAYGKSFLSYYHLMDYLGEETFLKALKGYMASWNGKHPIPHDFFNSINTHSGQDLTWFWESWYMEKNHADLALGALTAKGIEVVNVGRLFMPIHLTIIYKDGSEKTIQKKMDVWNENKYRTLVPLEDVDQIAQIDLGFWNIADVDMRNNSMELSMDKLVKISTDTKEVFDAVLAEKFGADEYGMKKYVMAFLKEGPNRERTKEDAMRLQKAHMDNIGRMAEAGQLVLAGPFLSEGEVRGIYIFNVETIAEAKALTETDPAVKEGSLVMELKEWWGSAALMDVNRVHKTITKNSKF